jgi:hypothetical protein
MRFSGKELSEKIGCARSTLSEATKKGHRVKGRYDVQAWAEFGPSGRVRGYDVPEDAAFLSGSSARENPNSGNSAPSTGDSAPSADAPTPDLGLPQINQILKDHEETTRTVAEEAGDTTQLVSDETDVEGTARNAGMAYVAGQAVQYDTPGALAFWTVGSALAGGVGGHAVSDGNPWAALIGAVAFGSAGYLVYEQQPRRQEGSAPRRDQRSGQQGQQNGDLAGRRGQAVNLDVPPSMNTDLT